MIFESNCLGFKYHKPFVKTKITSLLRKMINLVVAFLFLAIGMIDCDTSQTIKGTHKHTFLIHTETKSKRNDNVAPISGISSFGVGNLEWPNDEYKNIKWPLTESDSDSLKWSNIGSSPLEWSNVGSISQNKQFGQSDVRKNNKQVEEWDQLTKLSLGIDNSRPVSTLDKVKKDTRGEEIPRPITDSEDVKKMLIAIQKGLPQQQVLLESGDSLKGNSNTNDQELTISTRNIKARPLMGSSYSQLCPEDKIHLLSMLGMKPLAYRFIEISSLGNQNQNQQAKGSRQQRLLSGIKTSDTRNVRSRNRIRSTRRPLISKLRSLSTSRNNGN